MASKKTRIILITALVALLAAIGLGVIVVYERGLNREGILEKAMRAIQAKNYEEAARHARDVLKSEPDNQGAREILLEALYRTGDYETCKEIGAGYIEDGAGNEYAAIMLCRIAMEQGETKRAGELAQSLADTNPPFAYQIRALVQDHQGITRNEWRGRLAAAQTMRALASVAKDDSVKAEALIFASTIALEVAPFLPAGRARLVRRTRRDLEAAVTAVAHARQNDHGFPYEFAMGRIHVLSDDEEEAADGADMLRAYVSGSNRDEHAIAALAMYHVRRKEAREAADLIRLIQDNYLWRRMLWYLERSESYDIALEILDSGPERSSPERRLERGDLLLRTKDDARQAEGRRILEEIIKNTESTTAHIMRALMLLAVRTDIETATRLAAEEGLHDRNDNRITALLVALDFAEKGDKERAFPLVERLARETDSPKESLELLRILGGAGPALDHYLDLQIAKGGEAGTGHRLRRALTLLMRARKEKDTGESAVLRGRVMKDLESVLADKTASRGTLVLAFDMASSLGKVEIAGRLIGRALLLEGEPADLDVVLLRSSRQLEDEETRRRLAGGIRAVALETPGPAYLGAVAYGLESRWSDPSRVLAQLDAAMAEEGSRLPAMQLACRVALELGLPARAEKVARGLLKLRPGNAARDLLAGVLLKRESYGEVVELYEDVKKSAVGYLRLVAALMGLDSTSEALEQAKEALREHPDQPALFLVLADVHQSRGDLREALSFLNLTPSSHPTVLHRRAELLLQLDDVELAEQLYEALIMMGEFKDLRAWEGLYEVYLRQDRQTEFIQLSDRVLAVRLKEARKPRSLVRYLRARALEARGKMSEALIEYDLAIADDGANWRALNNAAWLIATVVPSRIDAGKEHIKMALKIKPGSPTLLDTAAEVHAVARDYDGALVHMDAALARKPKGKMARYLFHKGRILQRADRTDEAQVIFERVAREYPDDMVAGQARVIVAQLKAEKEAAVADE